MAEDKSYHDIRLKSEEVNEILGKPPKIVYRMGNSVILIILMIFFIISAVVKYPTSLRGNITIRKVTNKNSYIVLGVIPINNAASLKINQTAIVVLNAYPEANYGKLFGKVSKIEPYSSPSYARFEIQLDKGLRTNKGFDVSIEPILSGSVTIITKNNSILKNLLPFK